MSENEGVVCARCLQTLSQGNTYCIACGFDNADVVGKKYSALQQSEQRIERAGMLRKLFRVIGFGRFLR